LANAGIGFFCVHSHTSFHHEKGSTAPEKFYYNLDFKFLKEIADAGIAETLFYPIPPSAESRQAKIPSPRPPFLFARLLETSSDFFRCQRD
jgi:hypothetical protein